MYRKILIALSGKETDSNVVAHVQTLVENNRAELTLLRVITVAADGAGGLGIQFQTEIGSSGWRRKNRAEACMGQWARRLRERGLRVETALVIGTRSEADEIVDYAAKCGYDLIVMASDSRPWFKRWIGGCPADGVLRKATVPTLFVNGGMQKVSTDRKAPKENKMMALFGNASL